MFSLLTNYASVWKVLSSQNRLSVLANSRWLVLSAEMISVSYHIKLYFLFGGLLIVEYVEQGTLFDFLHQNEFNSDRNITWARQIAAGECINWSLCLLAVLSIIIFFLIGLKYLHFDIPDQVVIHGNLKSMNGTDHVELVLIVD